MFIIINPSASNGKAQHAWQRTEEYLSANMVPYWYAISKDEKHLTELARQAVQAKPQAMLVGVGGDGTISLLATAIYGTEAVLGIIPAGTGNDLARSVGISSDPVLACRTVLEGKTAPLDLGKLNGKLFCNIVGAGLDAEVVAAANSHFKKYSGSLGYLLALLKQLAVYRPRRFRIMADGHLHEVEAWLVAVANGRYYGGGMNVAPDADPQDGLADVVVVGNIHRLNFLRIFPKVFQGKHVDHPAVHVLRASSVRVECQYPLFVQADGELIGKTPLAVEMLRHAISIRVPAQ